MSPLWSGKNTKQSNNQAKPSPTYNDLFLDSAQGPGIFTNSKNELHCAKYHFIEESSLLTSRKVLRAGMTVEAALVLPLFLFFVLNIGSVIEMIRLHGNMQLALWEVGNQAAVYAYALEQGATPEKGAEDQSDENYQDEEQLHSAQGDAWWKEFAGTVLANTFLKWQIADAVGEAYLEKSPVIGGDEGLVLWESDIVKENGEIELVVTYGAAPLFEVIGLPYFRMANRYYGHAWTGYQPETILEDGKQKTVFIAENAEVYHLFRDCTHLLLTIREIGTAEVDSARNQYGGRYSACEKCAEGVMPLRLFIAQEGDHYHYVRECPGLKRTIYVVTAQDAADLPLCSRCGPREEETER